MIPPVATGPPAGPHPRPARSRRATTTLPVPVPRPGSGRPPRPLIPGAGSPSRPSAAGPGAPARPPAWAYRGATWLSAGLLAVLVVASLAAPGAVRAAAPWVLVAGIVAGVPHGAVDHLVPLWTARRPTAVLAVAAAYLLAVLVVVAVLLRWPGPTLLAFLALSVWHFGTGEAEFAAERDGTGPGRAARWSAVAGVGLPVVAVAVLGDPARTADVLVALRIGGWPLDSPALRAAVVAAAAGGVLTAVGVALRAGRPRVAAEVLLVAAVLVVAPPAAAFGAYFGGWHAVRHTARLLALTPAGPGRDAPAQVLARFARAAALPSAAAFAVLAVLWSRRDVTDPAAAVAVLLALTFPHAAVVGWLDRRGPALRRG